MVKDSVLLDAVMEWRVLTRSEKKALEREVEQLRKKVKAYWKEPPLGASWAFWYESDEIAMDLSSCYWPGGHHAIERVLLLEMFSPEALAWEQTCLLLANALNDPIVKMNPVAVALIEKASDEARQSDPFKEEIELFEDLRRDGARQAASARASKAAKSKNIESRAWVLIEWACRINKAQSKSAFARRYAALVESKFGLSVTPNTIERSWLPKG